MTFTTIQIKEPYALKELVDILTLNGYAVEITPVFSKDELIYYEVTIVDHIAH